MESKNRSTAAAAPELPGRRLSAHPWKRENTGAEPAVGTGRHAVLAAWRIYGGGPWDTYRGGGPALAGCRQRALFAGDAARGHSMPLLREWGLTGCLRKTKTDDRGR